jgi:hypothetical protein
MQGSMPFGRVNGVWKQFFTQDRRILLLSVLPVYPASGTPRYAHLYGYRLLLVGSGKPYVAS